MTLPNARDIALIFLILQAFLGCLVPLMIFFFIARGLGALNRKAREAMPTVQEYAQRMSEGTDQVSQRLAAPMISLQAKAARWQAMSARGATYQRPAMASTDEDLSGTADTGPGTTVS